MKKLRVGITGSTGLIGRTLSEQLKAKGHEPVQLVRRQTVPDKNSAADSSGDQVVWDPEAEYTDSSDFEGVQAVVHLAGEPIAARRWTQKQKDRIAQSRIQGTRFLSETLANLKNPPDVMVSASAIGFYGDQRDSVLDESANPGDDFLSRVCQKWEASTKPAQDAGIRVCHARTGIVLTPSGGALAKMLLPFKLGLGGNIGNGRQWMSWITLKDEVESLLWLLTSDIHGPVNLTAPNPVTNAEFTSTLGRVLKRPAFLPTPKLALSALWGRELAEALLYSSIRVNPSVLQESGFEFNHPELEPALQALLNS